MDAPSRPNTCRDCRHFRDDPAYLEAICSGLASLGSAYASVRGEDGICDHHGRYVSARPWCDAFLPQLEAAERKPDDAR
jgi:hypothetical protein